MRDTAAPFSDAASVASYVDDTPQKVPGLADLHKITTLLLDEGAPSMPHVLVVGAGGGLEIKAMAQLRSNWRFTGVDPSTPMLDIARQTTSLYSDRIDFLLGTIDQVPAGPFDGATCLLTLHFLDRSERLHTLREVRRRMKPGGVFVAAHHIDVDGQAETWLARSAAFAAGPSSAPEKAATSARAMAEHLPLLTTLEEEACFREAGFEKTALFYAALSFRGWVMTA